MRTFLAAYGITQVINRSIFVNNHKCASKKILIEAMILSNLLMSTPARYRGRETNLHAPTH